MIPMKFTIRDRGATPRGMAKRMNGMKKIAWDAAAILFHTEMRDNRFTNRHAAQAGYTERSHRYNMRKLRNPRIGHTRPLEFSGRTRRAVREANIVPTSQGASIRYRGARVLNFRNPKSQIRPAVEFTTVIAAEATLLAAEFDRVLDQQLKSDQTENR